MTVANSSFFPSRPAERRDARSAATSRRLWLAMSLLYAFSIAYAHSAYLSYLWAYVGFSYHAPGPVQILAIIALVGLPIRTMPTLIDRPSALILFILYVVVHVPAVVICIALRYDSLQTYWPILLAMCVVFMAAGAFTQRSPPTTVAGGKVLGQEALTFGFLAMWAVGTTIMIAAYSSIMTIASVDEIYAQRFAVERSITALGYVRTYYSSVLCPALIAIGLVNRRYLIGLLGAAGCLISYMVDAQKTIFVMPFVMVALYFALSSRRPLARSAAAATGMLALLVLASITLRATGPGDFLSGQLVFRAIAIPGLSVSQYYELFGQAGYTWWSNITGISLLVSPPAAFASDPYWPVLGEIVGREVYRSDFTNANANLFAGEGAAAAGWIGVLVIGIVLIAWLRLLDLAVAGWNRTFVLLLVLPLGIALTNVHLSTALVSFGGALLTLLFAFYKPAQDRVGN